MCESGYAKANTFLGLYCLHNIKSRFSPDEANLSRVTRKPAFCIFENKDADQLCGNRTADQRLCFRYTDITIPLLPKPKLSSLQPSSVIVQPGLCRTWSEPPKTGFLTTRLISECLPRVLRISASLFLCVFLPDL